MVVGVEHVVCCYGNTCSSNNSMGSVICLSSLWSLIILIKFYISKTGIWKEKTVNRAVGSRQKVVGSSEVLWLEFFFSLINRVRVLLIINYE